MTDSLFEAEDKSNCAACHTSQIDANGGLPFFTNFSYDNLGIPANPLLNISYPAKSAGDLGLGAILNEIRYLICSF